ncbi:MAG: NifC-like protein ABC-type porter [Candidatus Wolfebacteria bacterium GW2011_GWE1_48_7]|uniref:NifC-like protein ABC-type porter n=2 Tax=Candidatus Wolfeibacteriota TaxID=1752735 RepID=A0A0G1U5W3_9BACT|nr:MAG: NifC-like protein ABC-type porter, molybdate transport system permease protein [Candidatus Wolfebacteria bacterium GW2011_GWB1_47_1]KKU36860.1 MAG: NifC-like protein ABC-type porter [Candidatus Wolfebacteria bacterium GW2011_GWC2_46_275]KKU42469.1 MAG: NifC-like protein ABC-type porter [Candidatus Wolfebacteria bacterium GW2011_GWB2_46_69]KKU54254.1 MAG: NifC-like protein ABC-type porter [Candidatus Wolfebacteria bacterium GW2011_GWC1_47_103]KKU59622.1 MAG: NifC-like protein ABC-type po
MNHQRNTLVESAVKVLAFSWIAWFLFPVLFLIGSFMFKFSAMQPILTDDRFWWAFGISLISAFVVVALTALFVVPMAYFLAYGDFRGKKFLETLLIDIPQTLPPVAVGVIYVFAFGVNSPIHLAFTFLAVVIAKLIVSAPFALGYVLRRFREIRTLKIDLVARSLGANTYTVIFRVLVPMARQDIIAGLTLVWARAMGEFGGSLIFAGVVAYKTEILPTYANRVVHVDPLLALGATAIMVLFALVALTVTRTVLMKK